MGRKAVFCLLYFLAVVFTGLLLAAAVLSWRASFVSPEQGGFWATIALLMPVTVAIYVLVAAVLVSSISTLRLKPKQILAQME